MRGAAAWLSVALASASLLTGQPVGADERGEPRRRDRFAQPQTPGTKLKLFGFWGPGFRAQVEHRDHLEEGMSEYWLQGWADANYGFGEGSLHADVRVFLFGAGISVGHRYDWHVLKFEPDASGLDHGKRELDRDLRRQKDDEGDYSEENWSWAEGRLHLFVPLDKAIALSNIALRWEDRVDNSFDWFNATVYDRGVHLRWETMVLYRDRWWGFAGPALRVLNMDRTFDAGTANERQERATEWHYGIVLGTSPNWSSANDVILVRAYATFGLDHELMGTHTYGAPIQIVAGYQSEIDF
jgi:hypothetical protein